MRLNTVCNDKWCAGGAYACTCACVWKVYKCCTDRGIAFNSDGIKGIVEFLVKYEKREMKSVEMRTILFFH